MPQAAHMSCEPVLPTGLQVQPSPEVESRQGLEQAFALFNQMSVQLTDSYSLLEARVTELKGELAVVSAQRMQELAEKERLANRLQHFLHLFPAGGIIPEGRGVVDGPTPPPWGLPGEPL